MKLALSALLAYSAAGADSARASVTLLLEQPYGGMSVMNPTGHSAIYFDHICAETPSLLRPCRPGELGAVLSRYDDIHGYDWLAIPLLPYLYAVDRPEDIPASVDEKVVADLRNQYRRRHLASIASDDKNGNPPVGNWYELAGSAFDRTIYGFQVDSTAEQEERFMALLNDRKNVERYNGAFRNCADFARVTLNRFYPHAVRRNFIGDLGLTTPKSVARGLTRYAAKHPEANLHVFVVPQVKGSLPRSHNAQGVAQSLITRYGVPLTLISPFATGAMVAAYLGHGRFDVPRDVPVLDLSVPALASISQQDSSALRTNPEEALPVSSMAVPRTPSAGTATAGDPNSPVSSMVPASVFSAPVLDAPIFH